jgi:hypothetical protein
LIHQDMPAFPGAPGQHTFPQKGRRQTAPDPGPQGRAEKGDHQIVAGLTEQILNHQGKLPIGQTQPPGQGVPAKGDDVLVVHGKTGKPHLLAGPGHQIVIVAHGHIRLKVLDEFADLAEPGPLGGKLAQGVEHRGQGGHPVIFINGQRAGDFHHRELGAQDRGAPVMGDKQKVVLGKMAGDGKGPHGMAVQGAVDAVEDSGHGQSIDQGRSNDNGKMTLKNRPLKEGPRVEGNPLISGTIAAPGRRRSGRPRPPP